jgi:hypothetical protein
MTKNTETAKCPPVKKVRTTGIAAKNQLSPNPKHDLCQYWLCRVPIYAVASDGTKKIKGGKSQISEMRVCPRQETTKDGMESTNPKNFQRYNLHPLSYSSAAAIIDDGASTPEMPRNLAGHPDMLSVWPAASPLCLWSKSPAAEYLSTIFAYCILVLSSTPLSPKSPAPICHPLGFI